MWPDVVLFIFHLSLRCVSFFCFFFFNDTATTEIYTLSLHDALPISSREFGALEFSDRGRALLGCPAPLTTSRSEEHTSELQSHSDLVCRLLLEKKKKKKIIENTNIYSLNSDTIQT